eukprot:g6558.t1
MGFSNLQSDHFKDSGYTDVGLDDYYQACHKYVSSAQLGTLTYPANLETIGTSDDPYDGSMPGQRTFHQPSQKLRQKEGPPPSPPAWDVDTEGAGALQWWHVEGKFPSPNLMVKKAHDAELTMGFYANNYGCGEVNTDSKRDENQIKGDVMDLKRFKFDQIRLDSGGSKLSLEMWTKAYKAQKWHGVVENSHGGGHSDYYDRKNKKKADPNFAPTEKDCEGYHFLRSDGFRLTPIFKILI